MDRIKKKNVRCTSGAALKRKRRYMDAVRET